MPSAVLTEQPQSRIRGKWQRTGPLRWPISCKLSGNKMLKKILLLASLFALMTISNFLMAANTEQSLKHITLFCEQHHLPTYLEMGFEEFPIQRHNYARVMSPPGWTSRNSTAIPVDDNMVKTIFDPAGNPRILLTSQNGIVETSFLSPEEIEVEREKTLARKEHEEIISADRSPTYDTHHRFAIFHIKKSAQYKKTYNIICAGFFTDYNIAEIAQSYLSNRYPNEENEVIIYQINSPDDAYKLWLKYFTKDFHDETWWKRNPVAYKYSFGQSAKRMRMPGNCL